MPVRQQNTRTNSRGGSQILQTHYHHSIVVKLCVPWCCSMFACTSTGRHGALLHVLTCVKRLKCLRLPTSLWNGCKTMDGTSILLKTVIAAAAVLGCWGGFLSVFWEPLFSDFMRSSQVKTHTSFFNLISFWKTLYSRYGDVFCVNCRQAKIWGGRWFLQPLLYSSSSWRKIHQNFKGLWPLFADKLSPKLHIYC